MEAARGLTALGVASQLAPAVPVEFTPDIICAVCVSVLLLVSCLSIFKFQNADPNNKNDTETPAKRWTIALVVPLLLGLVAGSILHQIRWNYANPAYYAAEQGMNALFR